MNYEESRAYIRAAELKKGIVLGSHICIPLYQVQVTGSEDIFPRRSIPTERGWRLTENLSAERNLHHM